MMKKLLLSIATVQVFAFCSYADKTDVFYAEKEMTKRNEITSNINFQVHVDYGCTLNSASAEVHLSGDQNPNGISITWSNGSTGPLVTNLANGSYSVVVTDVNGNSAITNFHVDHPSPMVVQMIGNDISCHGENNGQINAVVSGGTPNYTYQWNDGFLGSQRANLAAGQYLLMVTDVNGCTTTAEYHMHEPQEITTASSVKDLDCYQDNSGSILLNPNGGVGGFTYFWDNGQNSNYIENLSEGDYSVIISDANDCMIQKTYSVNQPDELEVTADVTHQTSPLDLGSIDISLTGGTPGYSFVWSNGELTEDIYDLIQGDYQLAITDDNNCETTHDFTVQGESLEILDAIQEDFKVFPNPTNAVTTLSYNPDFVSTMQVYSNTGKLIESLPIDQTGNVTIEIENNGVYFVEVLYKDGQSKTEKLIVTK